MPEQCGSVQIWREDKVLISPAGRGLKLQVGLRRALQVIRWGRGENTTQVYMNLGLCRLTALGRRNQVPRLEERPDRLDHQLLSQEGRERW